MKFKDENRTEWESCHSKTLRETAHRKKLHGCVEWLTSSPQQFCCCCFPTSALCRCFSASVLCPRRSCKVQINTPSSTHSWRIRGPPPSSPCPYPLRASYQAAYHDHSFVTPEKEVSGFNGFPPFRAPPPPFFFFFFFADRFLWQRAERWSGVAWGYCLGEEGVDGGPREGPSAIPPLLLPHHPSSLACVCVCVCVCRGGGVERDVCLLQLRVCPLFAGIGFSGLGAGVSVCVCVGGGGEGERERDVFLLQLCVCPLFAGIGFSGLETGLWEVVGVGVLLKLWALILWKRQLPLSLAGCFILSVSASLAPSVSLCLSVSLFFSCHLDFSDEVIK